MRVVALTALFLAGGTAILAQYTPPKTTTLPDGFGVSCMEPASPVDGKHAKNNALETCSTPVGQGCPVDMRVRQQRGGATVAVDENGVKRRVFAQRLRLFLNDQRRDKAGQKIVSAAVTVHGTGTKARMQPLGSGSNDYFDLNSSSMVRTLKVDLAKWDEPGVSGDFLIPGFTSANRVDLEFVTYEDGSTWKLGKNDTCRVAPDPLMLINR